MVKFEHQKRQLDHLKSLAKIAADSKQYQNMTDTSLLNLMLSAQDLGISPMKAINGGFYVVNGKVCMSTALMADRIRKAGHSIKIIEMGKEKCIIIAQRKDNGDSLKFEYTWEDATLAGLVGSPTWKKFPKLMLYNRCMSAIARILFSDVVGNSYSEEERFDIQGIAAEERPFEDQEQELTVIIPEPIDNKISEVECAELDSYLEQDQEAIPKILKLLSIENVYDIPMDKFPGILATLKRRKEERSNESSRVA